MKSLRVFILTLIVFAAWVLSVSYLVLMRYGDAGLASSQYSVLESWSNNLRGSSILTPRNDQQEQDRNDDYIHHEDHIPAVAPYLEDHDSFPVVVLCYNRADKLDTTLESLLNVRGVEPSRVLVVQDGSYDAVTKVIQRRNIQHIQRPDLLVLTPQQQKERRKDKGIRIAEHYKYALKKGLDHFIDAPGIVVVEDDFLFSPDFMEWFVKVAPVVESDPTLWIASAWNDNGFKNVAQDKDAVVRTDLFPGLGWLLLRSVWHEIEPLWPHSHWDWFMRSPQISKDRDSVYPEVNRVYHTGSKGTFMDVKTHKKYFESINYNTDPDYRFPDDLASRVEMRNYEARFKNLVQTGVHIKHGSELRSVVDGIPKVVWFIADWFPQHEKKVQALCGEFHIWHQLRRGARQGVHEFYYHGHKIILINVYKPVGPPCKEKVKKNCWFYGYKEQTKWISLKPLEARVFKPSELLSEILSVPIPTALPTSPPPTSPPPTTSPPTSLPPTTLPPTTSTPTTLPPTSSPPTTLQPKMPVKHYLETHSSFPIVVLCYNRADKLETTLDSLLKVRNVSPSNILVIQDGAIDAVTRVIQRKNIQNIQRPEVLKLSYKEQLQRRKDKGIRIAEHYKYALHRGFQHFPDAPGVVVVEDDFLFSPDFMDWFASVAPVVEADPTLWIASAWNDNGFKGVVQNKSNVLRTDMFPGLGWLLLRSVWKEVEPIWPHSHWDWFMRDPKVSKFRDSIYPEVPRVYHAGSKGTFMDMKTHLKYFQSIDYNTDADTSYFNKETISSMAILENYDRKLQDRIEQATHIKHGAELRSQDTTPKVVWFAADWFPQHEKNVQALCGEFHIWHQLRRGARQAVHEFYYLDQKIILINTYSPIGPTCKEKIQANCWFYGYPTQSKWVKFKPPGARVFTPNILLEEIRSVPVPSRESKVVKESPRQLLAQPAAASVEEGGVGSIESYVSKHSSFPIVVLSHNRPQKLAEMIKSLLLVRGVEKSDILVAQDGEDAAALKVIEESNLKYVRRSSLHLSSADRKDSGHRIASHYLFALTSAMSNFKNAPGIVVVENDFVFSPDFMEYFMTVGPAIEKDPTLWVASAWNDNGFKGVARSKSKVLRTDFFPGLGWLLPRSLWENELKDKWPETHWDWFMRDPVTRKNRDCLYPEVPRVYHTGVKGAYMNVQTHNQYFRDIDYNRDHEFRWTKDMVTTGLYEAYNNRISREIENGHHIVHGSELKIANTSSVKVVWIDANWHPNMEGLVKPLTGEFHIWHQLLRGARQGVHEFWYHNHKVILINTFKPPPTKKCVTTRKTVCWFHGYEKQTEFIKLKPPKARVFKPHELYKELTEAVF